MKSIQFLAGLTTFLLCINFVQAQTKSSAPIDELNVEAKFNYLIEKSERFKEYQVVNRRWIRKVRDQVGDTLTAVKNDLQATQNTVSQQKKDIENLKKQLDNTNGNLATISEEKNSIQFLGANIPKGTYKGIMWGIIAGLALLSGILFLSFRRSYAVTSKTETTLKRVQDEYDAYRERTLKKEQKIMRRLQDELNKSASS